MAAEAEIEAASVAIGSADSAEAMAAALDRYLLAVIERNTLRAGRP